MAGAQCVGEDLSFRSFLQSLGDDQRQIELAQIQRIYGSDEGAKLSLVEAEVEGQKAATIVSLRLLPLDPDIDKKKAFPGDNRLGLKFELDARYPKSRPAVTLLPAPQPATEGDDKGFDKEGGIDAFVERAILTSIRMYLDSLPNQPSILKSLRWLDKNLLAILETAEFLKKRDAQPQAASNNCSVNKPDEEAQPSSTSDSKQQVATTTSTAVEAPKPAQRRKYPNCPWTPALQTRFEEALLRFWSWQRSSRTIRPSAEEPSSNGTPENRRRAAGMQSRWEIIAQATGSGVTALDCVKRYREIRAAIASAAAARAASGEPVSSSPSSEASDDDDDDHDDAPMESADSSDGTAGGSASEAVDNDSRTARGGTEIANDHDGGGGGGGGGAVQQPERLHGANEKRSSRPALTTGTERGRGVRVSLLDTQSTGLSFLQCSSVSLQVKCGRCGADDILNLRAPAATTTTTTTTTDGVASQTTIRGSQSVPPCARCGYSSNCRVAFEARGVSLLAESVSARDTLAFIRMVEGRSLGKTIVDLASTSLLATCESCGGEELLKKLRVGDPFLGFCPKCHEKRALAIPGAKFLSIGLASASAAPYSKADAAAAAAATRRRRPKRETTKGGHGLVVGSALPRHGSCKHYARSRRWYRFPCCGLLFPCDECHAEARVLLPKASGAPAAVDDASNVCERDAWAHKMVCGFCSAEQGVSKTCKRCKADVTGSTSGKAFWEGGIGQRDAAKRSNKDPTKMRGRNKTVSRKAAAKSKKK